MKYANTRRVLYVGGGGCGSPQSGLHILRLYSSKVGVAAAALPLVVGVPVFLLCCWHRNSMQTVKG